MSSIAKFLKKLTIFDWLVILVVFAGLIFLSSFILKKEKWVKVEVKVSPGEWWWEIKSPPYWLADRIKKGDRQYDGLGRTVAEVLETRIYEAEGERKRIYLTLNLKVEINKRKKKFVFNHRPLEIGKDINLELGATGFKGLVTYIEGVPDLRIWEEKVVKARWMILSDVFPETMGVMPWKAEAIKVGDQMRDTQRRVAAEVLNKEVRPAEKIVVTSDGRVFVRQDPIKKDVFLTLKLKTFKQNGINYFLDDIKVKVDQSIPLYLPNIDLWPTITEIVE